jgi:hypothetical protein
LRRIGRKKIFGLILLLIRRVDKADTLAERTNQRADSVTASEIARAVLVRLARLTVIALLLNGNCLLGLPLLSKPLLDK